MPKEIQIQTTDGYVIHGILDAASSEADDLIVLVHAYAGSKDDRLLYNAARSFSGEEFDVFRLDLYGAQDGNRAFHDTSFQTYTEDLNAVLQHFSGTYKNIHVIGHSLGGTIALSADMGIVRSFVLWEPADLNLSDDDINKTFVYNDFLGVYISKGGLEFLVGKELVEDLQNLDVLDLISHVSIPKYIVGAGKGNKAGAERLFNHAQEPKTLDILEDADHSFESFAIEEQLFSMTREWLRNVPERM